MRRPRRAQRRNVGDSNLHPHLKIPQPNLHNLAVGARVGQDDMRQIQFDADELAVQANAGNRFCPAKPLLRNDGPSVSLTKDRSGRS